MADAVVTEARARKIHKLTGLARDAVIGDHPITATAHLDRVLELVAVIVSDSQED